MSIFYLRKKLNNKSFSSFFSVSFWQCLISQALVTMVTGFTSLSLSGCNLDIFFYYSVLYTHMLLCMTFGSQIGFICCTILQGTYSDVLMFHKNLILLRVKSKLSLAFMMGWCQWRLQVAWEVNGRKT